MFDAQLLKAPNGFPVSVYGPWMQRGGDRVICTLDLVACPALGGPPEPTLKVQLFTKSNDEAGNGTDADGSTFIDTNTLGRTTQEWGDDLKDLVRYKFTLNVPESDGWALFRMLPPAWFDAVKA